MLIRIRSNRISTDCPRFIMLVFNKTYLFMGKKKKTKKGTFTLIWHYWQHFILTVIFQRNSKWNAKSKTNPYYNNQFIILQTMLLYCLYRTINGLLKNGRNQDAELYPMLMVYSIEYQYEEPSIRLSVIKQEKQVMGFITYSNWSTVQQKEIKY